MQHPTVTLQKYSGGTLNVVPQITVQLRKGDRHPQALVYIQEGAPVDLLLSTDALPLLAFHLQEPVAVGQHLGMFSGRALVKEQGNEGEHVGTSNAPVRFPADQHGRCE